MDRRSWPWKKKSSATDKAVALLDSSGVSLTSEGSQNDKDNYKKPNYVQISVESYTHLTGLDDQVKGYEDQVKAYEDQFKTLEDQIDELNEKLSDAHAEISSKEEIVKQHAKVAEEAVSGWEKAEAETATLKTHLEAVTLSKLTAEDKSAHLDGALKECMRQIRNLKEEHEHKLQDLVLAKNKQCDNMKREFEARMANMEQELRKTDAENAALSRSLHERSNMLMKMSEEKSQAESEIEMLKSNVESCEREINSLKYELHISSKELEIRNEEKNMSLKSAEAVHKQHIEGVKKIAKLEAECQRLRGLVRKKLPGPAALAQMKMEVESLGYGDIRMRRSPVRPSSPHLSPHAHHMSPVPEFSLDGGAQQKFQKENEFLTERLLAMEEETKMLKEALANRNSELQASRSTCAKTASRLQSLESQLQQRVSTHNASNPPSMTSLSEDGNDDAASVAESWTSALISEVPHSKDKHIKDRASRTDSTNHLELMDDFLEMEKLAGESNDANGPAASANGGVESENQNNAQGVDEKKPESSEGFVAKNTNGPETSPTMVTQVQSRISKVFESISENSDAGKLLEEIKLIVQEMSNDSSIHQDSAIEEEKHCSEDATTTTVDSSEKDILPLENGKKDETLSEELAAAISHIHAFILRLRKEAKDSGRISESEADDEDGLNNKIERFSAMVNKVLDNETLCWNEFILALSYVMEKASSNVSFNFVSHHRRSESEANSPDCIDKVALPEDNKTPQAERYSTCSHCSDSSSNPEVPHEANIVENPSWKCSFEEYEQMKVEKEKFEKDYAVCVKDLETTKSQLQETEQLLDEVKSKLTASERTIGLTDTQLRCMAESYKSLEKRAEEFEKEINGLRSKIDGLETELRTEKDGHQDALTRCQDLEEQLQRGQECPTCSSSAVDADTKNKQEHELAAAAEKLAECQETIFLLGRQLQSLHRPQTDAVLISPQNQRNHHREEQRLADQRPTSSGGGVNYNSLDALDHQVEAADAAAVASNNLQSVMSAELPLDLHTAPVSPSEMDDNGNMRPPMGLHSPKLKPSKSGSSSVNSTPTPEKQSRGFSRFFSTKGKSNH